MTLKLKLKLKHVCVPLEARVPYSTLATRIYGSVARGAHRTVNKITVLRYTGVTRYLLVSKLQSGVLLALLTNQPSVVEDHSNK